jgi:hypothetical protein
MAVKFNQRAHIWTMLSLELADAIKPIKARAGIAGAE